MRTKVRLFLWFPDGLPEAKAYAERVVGYLPTQEGRRLPGSRLVDRDVELPAAAVVEEIAVIEAKQQFAGLRRGKARRRPALNILGADGKNE